MAAPFPPEEDEGPGRFFPGARLSGIWAHDGNREDSSEVPSMVRVLGALVERSLLGDRESRNRLFEQSAPIVRTWTRNLVGEERAPDLCQEVLLRAHRKLDSLKVPEAFLGWMRVMTKRMACNLMRRERPERRWWTLISLETGNEVWEGLPGREGEPGTEFGNAEEREVRLEAVWRGIHSLEPGLRRVAELYYRDGRSVGQISRMIGKVMGRRSKQVPTGTVKTMLARIRHAVRTQVAGPGVTLPLDHYPMKA